MKIEPVAESQKQPYEPPKLEQHLEWKAFTGNITSNGIGIGSIFDPSETGEE